MAINFLSPIRLTLALLPQMLEFGSGRIVSMSSVAAPLSSPGEAAYDASKAALAVFCEAMAVHLWVTGIGVTDRTADAAATVCASAADFTKIVNGELSGADAFISQQLAVEGDLDAAASLMALGIL